MCQIFQNLGFLNISVMPTSPLSISSMSRSCKLDTSFDEIPRAQLFLIFDTFEEPKFDSPVPLAGIATPLGRALETPAESIPNHIEKTSNLIGRGSFGEVFDIKIPSHRYVLKKINIARTLILAKNVPFVCVEEINHHAQKLKVEIKALKHLYGHPHIPLFIGSNYENGFLEIAMEYIDAVSSDKQKLNLDEIKILMKQLFQTLWYCHEEGVAHLDVKPSNILWSPAHQHMTLIDFEEGRFFDPKIPKITQHLSFGTFKYRDADINESQNPIRIDLYAAGKTCEVLLKRLGIIPEDASLFIERCFRAQETITTILQDPWLS